jgi:hypothetical protein
MKLVSLPPRRRHLINTIVPAVNLGIVVSLIFILSHLQTVGCRRLLYTTILSMKRKSVLWSGNTISSLLFRCIFLIFLFFNTKPMLFL